MPAGARVTGVSHQVVEQELAGAPGAAPSELHTTWNFVVIVLDCGFFMMGMAFVDPTVVLPVLMSKLHASDAAIGLMSGIQRAGWLLPQLLSASLVLHRERKWPFLFYACLCGRVSFYVMSVALMLPWTRGHVGIVLPLLFAGYSIFWFCDGFSGVPWHDIIARSIPATLRGRFFGSMQLLSGVLAAGAGVVVARVLGHSTRPFPSNFGVLFVLLTVGVTLSTICLGLVREPKSTGVSEQRPLAEIIRSIPETLRRHPRLRRLIIGQNLCGLGGLAAPFYVLYALDKLRLPAAQAGTFVTAGVVGAAGSSMIWAYLCDRYGSTRVIRGVAVCLILIPAIALLAPAVGPALGLQGRALGYLYSLVFLVGGAAMNGMWTGFTTYTMEIAPDRVRPLFLGLQATLNAPNVLMPMLGGLLLGVMSYQALFVVVIAGVAGGALYVSRLPEPRLEAQPA
jgi:MFS family permease